jgi:beta-galactosidase
VTVSVADKNAQMVPRSMNLIHFDVRGPGEIVATDNGDSTDMTPFPSKDRKVFNGLALLIIRAKQGQSGKIIVSAKSDGLAEARAIINVK